MLVEHILEIKIKQKRSLVILNQDFYSLGRSSKNTIVLKDSQVSRYHATIIRKARNNSKNLENFSIDKNQVKLDNYCFWIYDGNLQGTKSRNGLAINRQYYSSHLLTYGDLIELGDNVTLKYYKLASKTIKFMQALRPLATLT